ADLVLGQPDFVSKGVNTGGVSNSSLNQPYAVYSDGTRLFVSDSLNNRVLVWNSLPTSSQQPASNVLGQAGFGTNGQNQGGLSASTLYYPKGMLEVGGRFFLADTFNNRVLVWNAVPSSMGQA